MRFEGSVADRFSSLTIRRSTTSEFGGQLDAQLDCNKLQSTWKASGAELRFGKLRGCQRQNALAESMSDRMVRDWTEIRSYSVRSNLLYLA